jgi:ribosome-binding factor A
LARPQREHFLLSKTNRRGSASFVDPDFAEALDDYEPEGHSVGRRAEHKARQLCRQAQRALNLALAARPVPGLEQLYVDEVSPAPGCAHLLVHFVAPAGAVLPEVLASLRREAPRLRAEVARGVSRKRAPELSFVPAMAGGDADV